MADQFGIRVEGARELSQAIGRVDAGLRKELGQENKRIGQRVIDAAYPKPLNVGAGAGAVPRASALSTGVRIMAGGSWRSKPVQSWGKRPTRRDGKRPYIKAAFEADMDQIERDYLAAFKRAAAAAGIETDI